MFIAIEPGYWLRTENNEVIKVTNENYPALCTQKILSKKYGKQVFDVVKTDDIVIDKYFFKHKITDLDYQKRKIVCGNLEFKSSEIRDVITPEEIELL